MKNRNAEIITVNTIWQMKGNNHLRLNEIGVNESALNSRCCCKETPSTAGWNPDNFEQILKRTNK